MHPVPVKLWMVCAPPSPLGLSGPRMPPVPAIPPAVAVGEHYVLSAETDGGRRAYDSDPPTHVRVAQMHPIVIACRIVRAEPVPIIRIVPWVPAVPTIPIAIPV